ncbi:MAG: hypothetical protein ACLRNW_19745 [Neglectibacter sp.]
MMRSLGIYIVNAGGDIDEDNLTQDFLHQLTVLRRLTKKNFSPGLAFMAIPNGVEQHVEGQSCGMVGTLLCVV